MSKVKTKYLKRLGIKSKSEVKKARKYILEFAKCNRKYAYNNIAFNLGQLDSFSMFQTLIKNKQNNEHYNRF